MPQPVPCTRATTPSTLAIIGERVAAEMLGDIFRGRRRAIDRADDAEIVARRDPSVRPHDALEGGALRLGHIVGRLRVDPERVVAGEIAHREVMGVDMVAGLDPRRGEADDLVVLAHRGAGLDDRRRDLVPGRDVGAARDAFAGDRSTRENVGAGDDDVVRGVETNGEGRHGAGLLRLQALGDGSSLQFTSRPAAWQFSPHSRPCCDLRKTDVPRPAMLSIPGSHAGERRLCNLHLIPRRGNLRR